DRSRRAKSSKRLRAPSSGSTERAYHRAAVEANTARLYERGRPETLGRPTAKKRRRPRLPPGGGARRWRSPRQRRLGARVPTVPARELVHAHRGPGGGDLLHRVGVRAVQVGGRLEGGLPRLREGGVRRHVGGQRAAEDLQALLHRAVEPGRVAGRHAGDRLPGGLVRPAVHHQVEGVVHDAGRPVHLGLLRVVLVVVDRVVVLGRVVHVAERVAGGARGPRLLADLPDVPAVLRHGRVLLARVPLHARAHDVAHGLVDAAGLTPVHQAGGALGHAVGDLVARHVEGGERARLAPVAVAVVHLGAVPEGVDVVVVDVDVVAQRLAVAVDGVAAQDVLVEVVGRLGAVHGVHRALLAGRVGRL